MRKNQQGFTLIEILVALAALIITLAGGVVVLPTVRRVWQRGVVFTPSPTPTPYLKSCKAGEEPIYEKGVFIGCQEMLPIEYPATPIVCQTDSDCPQSNVLIPKCLSNRCVYVKDTRSLQSCLEEANQARKRVCEEMKIPLDEYGNCVGVDFVKDPYQECYDEYGQK